MAVSPMIQIQQYPESPVQTVLFPVMPLQGLVQFAVVAETVVAEIPAQ